ncbi:kinase-like domain-containing protein, partial [Pterulicium gracile]
GSYQLHTLLGEGGFGAVYDATEVEVASQSDAPRYAVKCMKKQDSHLAEYQARELALHKLVSAHPNVVTLHDTIVSDDNSTVSVVMDLCKGGDLLGPISRRELIGKNDEVKKLFLQLIDVVAFCHEKGVFHRDLKPDNVLLDGEGNMFLADFGLSSDEETSKGFGCGTKQYLSPECVGETSRDAYSHRTTDVWALGVILTGMLTGWFPWKMACSLDPCWKAFQADRQWFFDAFNVSNDAAQLLIDIFNVDSSARITLPALRKRFEEMQTFFPD